MDLLQMPENPLSMVNKVGLTPASFRPGRIHTIQPECRSPQRNTETNRTPVSIKTPP